MTRLAQGKRMHRGERVQREDEGSERYTLKEGERTSLLCNTHRGYRCIVTLLSPRSPLTENLRAYSKSRFPARRSLCRAYMSSILLVLSYIPLVYFMLIFVLSRFISLAYLSNFLSLSLSLIRFRLYRLQRRNRTLKYYG